MRNAELAEIRAILRAQAVVAPEPVRKGLFGLKPRRRKPTPPPRGPLNLTPLEPAIGAPRPEPRPVETPVLTMSPETEDAAPMLYLAPRRERFGLADEGARPVAPVPLLKLRSTPEIPSELEPRRRGASLAATEAAGLGADEILELHDMLSERLPQLLTQIDLEAKLVPPPEDQPSIASIVSAAEAARASLEQDAAAEAWAEAHAALQSTRWDGSPPAQARRQRMARVGQELAAEHAVLEGDLQAVRRARARLQLAA